MPTPEVYLQTRDQIAAAREKLLAEAMTEIGLYRCALDAAIGLINALRSGEHVDDAEFVFDASLDPIRCRSNPTAGAA